MDGLWEHQNGLKLETTDNPGWLVTVDENIDEAKFNEVSAEVRKRWSAEATRNAVGYEHYGEVIVGAKVEKTYLNKINMEVYAATLEDCLNAVAYILSATF